MSSRTISVLGCGWLGLPLAKMLVKQGYTLQGSTTTPAKLPLLAETGIKPYLLDLNQGLYLAELKEFLDCEILIINVPPKRNSGNNYLAQMEVLKNKLEETLVQNIIFVSSTSVYQPSSTEITEESPLDENLAADLIASENLFRKLDNGPKTTILRFAGLFGPGRQPGRFLAGKTSLPDAEAPVNLLHLDDCLEIISEIIKQEKWGDIFNACADSHPSRKEFYSKAAQKLNLPEPKFAENKPENSPGKRISNQKLKRELHYKFLVPDPLKAL